MVLIVLALATRHVTTEETISDPEIDLLNETVGYRIFIREQSDSYWLTDKFTTEEAAMEERREIKEGPLGSCFMVMVYAPDGTQLTER